MRMHNPPNMLEQKKGFAWLALAAPVAGLATAFFSTVRRQQEDK